MATHFVPYYEETFGHGLKLVDYNAPMVGLVVNLIDLMNRLNE